MKENPYFKEKLLQISGLPVQGMKIKCRHDRHSLQNKSGVPAWNLLPENSTQNSTEFTCTSFTKFYTPPVPYRGAYEIFGLIS